MKRAFAALLLFAVPYLLVPLGRGSLENQDDALHADVIREIAHGQRLLDFGYQDTVEGVKPLLFYWTAAVVVKVGGDGEFALRLVPALATLAAALLVFALARQLGASPWGALLAGLLFLGFAGPLRESRHVREDPLLCALLAGALLAQLRRAWIAWGVCVGLAAMTKGMFAGIAPVCALAELALWRRRGPYLGLATAAAIAAPWHIAQTVRHGWSFWGEYLGRNVLERASAGFYGDTDALFYLKMFATDDPVLSGLVVVGVVAALARKVRGAGPVLVWSLLSLIALSVVRTRFSHYALFVFPSLAALAATGLAWARLPALVLCGAVAAAPFVFHPGDIFQPDFAPAHKLLAREARARLPEGATLYVFDEYHAAARFYGERRTVLLTGSRDFYEGLRTSRLFTHSSTVRRVGPRDVAAIAGERSPFCCLTLADRERIIVRDAGAGVPPSAGLEILRAGDQALVCYRWEK